MGKPRGLQIPDQDPVIGRTEQWVTGAALACCFALVAGILIAMVAATLRPAVAAAALLALLLAAAGGGRVAVRMLSRPGGPGR